jgi:phage-related protein
MPTIGVRCHELRIIDHQGTFRIVYRTDPDAVVIADVFSKKTQKTPSAVIETCKRRLRHYDRIGQEE